MIEFSNINSFDAGQRESFEELICILARREVPENATTFQRIEGSGGDGGVEAIWNLRDNGKIGFQSKFFLKLANPQWRQIDHSVQRALEVHPELKKYIIALPCNLTGKKTTVGKGTSGWEKWGNSVLKWKEWADKKGIKVEFEVWTAADLEEKLLQENNLPIVEYWFGKKILNNSWFQHHINEATRKLDDRFNPNDHVEVSIESVFDAMVRGPGVIRRITDGFSKISETKVPNIKFLPSECAIDIDGLEDVNNKWDAVVSQQSLFTRDFSIPWDLTPVKTSLKALGRAATNLQAQFASFDRKNFKEKDKNRLEGIGRSLSELISSCWNLDDLLEDQLFLAEAERYVLLSGPAGAGKSHVLGQIAEQRTEAGLPTVLLLGQDFSDTDLWQQIGCKLGLKNRTEETVLGTLNTAGERKGVRTLLLIDAINEGVGAHYWKQRLLELSVILSRYPNLAMALSCREEYIPYAILDSLKSSLPKFHIKGFSTPEEMERAAIQYLDNKGIARPNTPWLSPEFSNPLFLKCTSEALKSQGKTEFPRGSQGISGLMALYLDALSWRTSASDADPTLMANAIRKLVNRFAEKMASTGCDYVGLSDANQLANECFAEMSLPTGKSWLQVLIETSLFRRDPPPFIKDSDPLNPPSELVRFAFQRFQDHLMAQSLIEAVRSDQPSAAFKQNGPLNFIFNGGKPENGICYKYAGLIASLSIIYPEKLSIEFATTLPDWQETWDNDSLLQEAFEQSFQWRRIDAFSKQTSKLFDSLIEGNRLGLILDVSITVKHPWNALYLHSHLINLNMPERDSLWTRWINWEFRESANQISRIVSWALSSLDKKTDICHLELASLVLTWCLSASYMTLRDRATKALTVILLKRSCIFDFLLEKMVGCDDPYVIERVYAAAFGACCIDQNPERLRLYSHEVFRRVFADREPPVALLTRDYALGIVELAQSHRVLSTDVQIECCYPPFKSNAPDFDLTDEEMAKLAEERGGQEIFWSASSKVGDFGRYSIPGRVDTFLTTSLSEPKPLSKETRKQLFIEEVINPFPERITALAQYKKQLYSASIRSLVLAQNTIKKEQMLAHEKAKDESWKQLESLLNPKELKRLLKEYCRDNSNYENYDPVSVRQCCLWIIKRAYELGWSVKLFPRDGRGATYSRYHNDLERIGKKYQRIALDEIQARLADNFWMLQGWPQEPCTYRYSDGDSRRNLEPTILPTDSHCGPLTLTPNHWIFQPTIRLPEVDENHLKRWPFEEDPTKSMGEKLWREDREGKRWLVLYEFNKDDRKYEPERGEHGLRYQEFRFFYCIFLKQGTTGRFLEDIKNAQDLDGRWFQPREFTDGPYLREAFWRDTWKCEKFDESLWGNPDDCKFAIPVADYHWESHLDKTLPDGYSNYLPQMWFAQELGLSVSQDDSQTWLDQTGNCVFKARRSDCHDTAVVIDEDCLISYLKKLDVEPVWIMIAERNTWPGGSNNESCWRRSRGAIWLNNGSWGEFGRNKDTKR